MADRVIFAQNSEDVSELELKNAEISYRAALEGMVLLKNNGALPVKPGRIALYGAGVPMTVKGGTGSGEVNERHAVTILEGMEKAGYEITTRAWINDLLSDYDSGLRKWEAAQKKRAFDIVDSMASPFQPPLGRAITDEDIRASGCDTAIFVVSRQAGEGADKKLDKGEFALQPIEIENITKIAENYKNSVLVINSGAYMELGGVDDKVGAVMFFCQEGQEGGRAFADVISGKVSPSGRLTDSWATTYGDIPFGMEYSYLKGSTGTELYKQGIFVGYRYFDSFGVKPRYPFGFGLSYTTFETAFTSAAIDGETVTVTASVTNTGSVPGKEVVQLYVSCPESGLNKEYKRLAAFVKTPALAAGESTECTLVFSVRDLCSFSDKMHAWLLDGGDYVLRLGASAADTRPAAVVTLPTAAIFSVNRSVCPRNETFDVLEAPARAQEVLPEDLPRMFFDSTKVKPEEVNYFRRVGAKSEKAKSIVASMSNADCIRLCMGTGIPGMIETEGVYTPGAVGRTSNHFNKKGLRNINLCDGPAGLRVLRRSGLSKSGSLRAVPGEKIISTGTLNEITELVKFRPGRDTLLCQYTTSFPVETALAQTWNTALLEEIGSAIGSEMDKYGISCWLAPAVNIHKNPLCGRNFEYMSEDPLLTGRMAAALVRGIQSEEGRYATVKHFACNNAEDDRMHSDSIVDERTLREIYLRAFEICVREAKPKCVMTSYNKVCGRYTVMNRDLVTYVLRNEWGFDGVVMSDWFSATPKGADAGEAIAAGNDLIMPGTAGEAFAAAAALRDGRLEEGQLRRSAELIAEMVLEANVNR